MSDKSVTSEALAIVAELKKIRDRGNGVKINRTLDNAMEALNRIAENHRDDDKDDMPAECSRCGIPGCGGGCGGITEGF